MKGVLFLNAYMEFKSGRTFVGTLDPQTGFVRTQGGNETTLKQVQDYAFEGRSAFEPDWGEFEASNETWSPEIGKNGGPGNLRGGLIDQAKAKAAETGEDVVPLIDDIIAGTGMATSLAKDLMFFYASTPLDLAAGVGNVRTAIRCAAIEARAAGSAAEQEVRFFRKYSDFTKALGPAGKDVEWHHIVGQHAKNVDKFGPEAIHNTMNLVKVPETIHYKITGFYNSKPGFAQGMTVRDWLAQKSWREQYEFGQQILQKALAGQPFP